jgi:TPP-dependent pyruvate/acetoin dehydrogenase alpha subunit
VSTTATDTLLTDLGAMARIRAFEERVSRYYRDEQIPGFVHLSVGQEAVAVGACGALDRTDFITTTHRGHGHCLAKGADADAMMAELFARATGTCHGKGGSMHIADPSLGILGANGIVGAGLSIAVGAGLAALRLGSGAVSVAFAGEGSTNAGAFHESLTLAVLWNAPVIFLIENNQFAEFSESAQTRRGAPLVDRALGYGLAAAEQIDGNDVEVVRAAVRAAVIACREGGGPRLIEAMTYRIHGHYEGDPLEYRDQQLYDEWSARDPIELVRKKAEAEGNGAEAQRLIEAAAEEMDRAVERAQAAPYPPESAVLEDVFHG